MTQLTGTFDVLNWKEQPYDSATYLLDVSF